MWRVPVTGNGTFDKVELAANQVYMTQLDGVTGRLTPDLIIAYEVGYLAACFYSAITQLGAEHGNSGSTSGYQLAGHNVVLPLDVVAKNLATQLRSRGFTLPTSYFVALSALPTEAAEGTGYVAGDLCSVTGGSKLVAAVLKVATVTGGGVETVTVQNMGLYSAVPADDVAATVVGSGDGTATFTMTWASIPVEYNS